MPAGFWADTNKIFRPGIAARMTANVAAAAANSRLLSFFSKSRRAFWLKPGTYVNFEAIFALRNCYAQPDSATGKPTDPTDPDDPKYNWTLLDSYVAMSCFDPAIFGPGLMLHMFMTLGNAPAWMRAQGLMWSNANNSEQVNWANPDATQALKDFFTALSARYASNLKFWCVGMAETLLPAPSSSWPAGMTLAVAQREQAAVLNHINTVFGGRIFAGVGSLGPGILGYAAPPICLHNPDPKLTQVLNFYAAGGTGDQPQALAMRSADTHFIKCGTEHNGLGYVTWRDDVANPFGNTSTNPPPGYHYPTTDELCWAFSSEGILRTHLMVITAYEWSGGTLNGIANMTLQNWGASLDKYMAGGSDTVPYLPASYTVEAADPESGEYTYVAAGNITTSATSATPTLPAGKQAGDLLLLATACRTAGETLNVPDGWVVLAQQGELALLGKIAADADTTVSSADAVLGHNFWSGGSATRAQIAAFSGDVFADLGGVVVTSVPTATSAASANIPTPAAHIEGDNRLIVSVAKKTKTAASNGATLTAPGGLANIIGQTTPADSSIIFAWGYTLQTDAVDIPASAWTQSVAESNVSIALTVALRAAEVGVVEVPDAPGNLAADTVTQTSMRVTHDDSADAAGYRYLKVREGATVLPAPVLVGAQTQAEKTAAGGFVWSGLGAATNYGIKALAYNSAGESALSAELQQATSTPADTTPPTYAGATAAVYDAESETIIVSHTQGSDNLTTQASLKYDLFYGVSGIDYGRALISFSAADAFVIDRDLVVGPEGGALSLALRCRDEAGNSDTNTAERVVAVPPLTWAEIGPFGNSSGSFMYGVIVYVVASRVGEDLPAHDPDNPAASPFAQPVLLDAAGIGRMPAAPGEYRGYVYNADGTYRGVLGRGETIGVTAA